MAQNMWQSQYPQSGGMFQGYGGGSSSYTPAPNIFGPQSFDMSGISSGIRRLEGARKYRPTQYSPYQFKTPEYGTTSPEEMKNIHEQALGVASRPVRAAAQERMRQMSQGLEGGRFTGAAQREAAMREGQETGENIQEISSDIGSKLSQARLGEMQEQRRALFQAEQDRQRQQAAEQYQSAGFTDQQARYLAEDALNRANMFMQYGFQLPQLQNQLNQSQQQSFQSIMDIFSQLGGT